MDLLGRFSGCLTLSVSRAGRSRGHRIGPTGQPGEADALRPLFKLRLEIRSIRGGCRFRAYSQR